MFNAIVGAEGACKLKSVDPRIAGSKTPRSLPKGSIKGSLKQVSLLNAVKGNCTDVLKPKLIVVLAEEVVRMEEVVRKTFGFRRMKHTDEMDQFDLIMHGNTRAIYAEIMVHIYFLQNKIG